MLRVYIKKEKEIPEVAALGEFAQHAQLGSDVVVTHQLSDHTAQATVLAIMAGHCGIKVAGIFYKKMHFMASANRGTFGKSEARGIGEDRPWQKVLTYTALLMLTQLLLFLQRRKTNSLWYLQMGFGM